LHEGLGHEIGSCATLSAETGDDLRDTILEILEWQPRDEIAQHPTLILGHIRMSF
jgi:hypothetical protein